MDSKTVFSNKDIITELFKHFSVNSLKLISIVSKEYNKQFKSMSKIEYIKRKYKESKSINSFITDTSKEICYKYKYGTPILIPNFCNFIKKITIIKNVEEYIYLIYYWIILLIHTINNNYSEIIIVMKTINYEKKLNKSFVSLLLKLMSSLYYRILWEYSGYSYNKCKLLKHISDAHIILFSKHQLKNNYRYVEVIYNKQLEFVDNVKKSEVFRVWIKKNFCLKLIEMVEK